MVIRSGWSSNSHSMQNHLLVGHLPSDGRRARPNPTRPEGPCQAASRQSAPDFQVAQLRKRGRPGRRAGAVAARERELRVEADRRLRSPVDVHPSEGRGALQPSRDVLDHQHGPVVAAAAETVQMQRVGAVRDLLRLDGGGSAAGQRLPLLRIDGATFEVLADQSRATCAASAAAPGTACAAGGTTGATPAGGAARASRPRPRRPAAGATGRRAACSRQRSPGPAACSRRSPGAGAAAAGRRPAGAPPVAWAPPEPCPVAPPVPELDWPPLQPTAKRPARARERLPDQVAIVSLLPHPADVDTGKLRGARV